MDLHLLDAEPTDEERAAVDALLGLPASVGRRRRDERARRAHRRLAVTRPRPAPPAAAGAPGGAGARRLDQRRRARLRLRAARRSAGRRVGRRHVLRAALDHAAPAARAPRLRRHRVPCKGADELCAALERPSDPRHTARRRSRRDRRRTARLDASPCLGLCDQAPAAFVARSPGQRAASSGSSVTWTRRHARRVARRRSRRCATAPHPRAAAGSAIPSLRLLRRDRHVVDPASLDAYRALGGYDALRQALAMGPDARDPRSDGVEADGPRRRRVSHRSQVGRRRARSRRARTT